ncbi:hypothetical protein ACHHYP_09122 [Achlya hypogyna]|uniref:Tim44-like domain-containing protein n=1 Tax=Achlya hypogyna TaxID=1202772 RepID=A0A1V9YNR2_ACHHY|nr:hypothetical protein ACHHYP_09122 [Achlya hypogyna]
MLATKLLRRGASFVRPSRAFSSAPPTFDARSFADAFERAYDDRDRLYAWDEQNIFKPDTSFVKKALSFALLHHVSPSGVLDLPDFLDGAQVALDLVLHTVYTPEFQAYVRDTSAVSPPVELLQSLMTPDCFNALVADFQQTPQSVGSSVELSQLDIHSGQFSGLLIDGQQMKLALKVLYHTTEHITSTIDGTASTSERDSYCQWTFETSIADPNVLDWQLIDMYDDDI